MSRRSFPTRRPSRLLARILAGVVALPTVLAALVSAGAARADGMPEPEVVRPAPKRHVVRTVHRHHRVHVRETRPLIGYEIKHVHEDLGAVVYVQPAWPSCQYVLDTAVVRTVRDSYTGRFDCGS